jgi:mannosyltransferase
MKIRPLVFLTALSLISGALLFFRIDHQSLWLDEVMSLTVAQLSPAGMVKFFKGLPEQHPLYYFLLRGWLIFGTSEAVLRSLSVVFAIASVWAIYLLAQSLFGQSLAKIAATLLCTSPFFIYYGQEARMYTLLCFLAIMNSFFLVLWEQKRSRSAAAGYVISGILGMYTHFFFLFLLGAQTCYLLYRLRADLKTLRTPALCQLVILLSYTPWALLIFFHRPDEQAWKGIEHILLGIPYTFLRFGVGYTELAANYQWKEQLIPLLMENAVILVPAFIVIGGLAVAGVQYIRTSKAAGAFVLCCLALPMIAALLASMKVVLVGERYFIVCFPFYIILIAAGMYQLGVAERKIKKIGIIAIALFAFINAKCLYDYYFSPEFGKAQWRDVARYVQKHSVKDDIIVLYSGFIIDSFLYYYRGEAKLRRAEDLRPAELANSERLWLIVAHANGGEEYWRGMAKLRRLETNKLFPLDNGIRVLLFTRG